MNLRRLGLADGALWRQAVSTLVPPDERSGELPDMNESDAALSDERCYLLVAREGSRCTGSSSEISNSSSKAEMPPLVGDLSVAGDVARSEPVVPMSLNRGVASSAPEFSLFMERLC